MITTRRNVKFTAMAATTMALSDLAAAHAGPAHTHGEMLSAIAASGLLAAATVMLYLRRRRPPQPLLRRRRDD